jgi:hypothetical protein
MPDLFGVDIAGIIASEIGPGVLPAILIKVTPGIRGADSTAGINPSEQSFTGRGVIEEYMDDQIDGTLIKKGDRKVILITNTFAGLPVPEPTDKIIIESMNLIIVNPVKRDPAAATYTCQCRL